MKASIKEINVDELDLIYSINYNIHGDFCVYIHAFPNGKMYVGATKNRSMRWKSGEGYIDNKEMYNAIQEFGWDNIQHEIVLDNLTIQQARELERKLISLFDAVNNGYNKSTGGDGLRGYLNKYTKRIMQLMESWEPLFRDHIVLLREIDGCEDESERVNNADYQMRSKWPDEYNAWRHGDPLRFATYWLCNLGYILSGQNLEKLQHFGSHASEIQTQVLKDLKAEA